MDPVYWALVAAAVTAPAVCLAAFFWLRIMRRTDERHLPPEDPVEELLPEIEAPDDDAPDEQAVAIAWVLHLLKSRYDNAARAMAIPSNAARVPVHTSVFGSQKRELSHYLWETEQSLHLFPVWDEIRYIFEDAGGAFSYQTGDEDDLTTITIPKDRVDFWRMLQSGGIEVFYTNAEGDRIDLILRSAPSEPFRNMLPDKEESYIISYIYPKSSKNIFDIKDEFYDLKARRERGELNDEEFNHEKKMILITM